MIKDLYNSAEKVGGRHFAMITVCTSLWIPSLVVLGIGLGKVFTSENTDFYLYSVIIVFCLFMFLLTFYVTFICIKYWTLKEED